MPKTKRDYNLYYSMDKLFKWSNNKEFKIILMPNGTGIIMHEKERQTTNSRKSKKKNK